MIERIHLKKYLTKALKKKEDNNTIFRYTTSFNIIDKNHTLNLNHNNIFYISCLDKKIFGVDKCIELKLASKKNIFDLITMNTTIISYGKNKKKPIKWFGNVAFDMDRKFIYPAENIPKGLFFIPKILIEKTENYATITFHTLLNKNINSIIEEYYKLESEAILQINKSNIKNNILTINSIPNKKYYTEIFNKYIDDINNNKYNKIVLSRIQEIELESKLNYIDIFNNMDINCTNYLFSLNKNEKFFGSTPEKIIHLSNNKFISEAIAGTYPKNNNYKKYKLLNNKKELDEHNFVIKHLTRTLKKYSKNIKISKSKILELAHLVHIQTSINGKLFKKKHILEILYNLYPTPAVAGYPIKKTINKINKNESFSRGWYGGCFGWFDQNGNGKFDVSIRCALGKNNKLIVFSGGGIVKESNLEKEWTETESKFKHLLSSIIK